MKKYMNFHDFTKNVPIDHEKQLSVCIATPDYLFVVKNMGIGSSFYHTAQVLVKNDLDVTILYCNLLDHLTTAELEHSKDRITESGVKLHLLFDPSFKNQDLNQFHPNDLEMVSSYMAYQFLKHKHFDIIIFPEWRGVGFYSLQAKKLGLGFRNTTLWVQTHSTSLWHGLNNEQFHYNEHDIRVFHLERRSVALADLVVSPTKYLLNWKKKHGFNFPKDTFVQPYILEWNLDKQLIRKHISHVKEFVFFGRLEKRKGLRLFCQALKIVRQELFEQVSQTITITFLGKITEIDGVSSYDYISESLEGTNFTLHFLTSFNSVEAVSYLKNNGRVAIIPSIADNSPLTVLECIYNKIPFIASDAGGIPEIVCRDDHAHALFRPNPRSLAEKMMQAITHGVSASFPVIDQEHVNIPVWIKALRWSSATHGAGSLPELSDSSELISICITRFDNVHNLCIALEGLARQTNTNFEVIIVDDGTCKNVIDTSAWHENDYSTPFHLTIINQENRSSSAVRCEMLKRTRGKYVIFMDGSHCPRNDFVETFLLCAIRSGYDALSCVAVSFPQADPGRHCTPIDQYLPLGGGLAPNIFGNYYGSGACLYKKEVLLNLAGVEGKGFETWDENELFSKTELSGAETSVVPEPLLYIRMHNGCILNRKDISSNWHNTFHSMLESFPWATFGDALLVSIRQKVATCDLNPYNHSKSGAIQKLIRASEHSLLSLRWLSRRMSEVGDHHGVVTALLDHYRSTSVFVFCLLEFVSYFLTKMGSLHDAQKYCINNDEVNFIKDYGNLISKRDTKGLICFVQSRVKDSIDRRILLAKLHIMHGDMLEGLKVVREAFIEIDNKYKMRNDDLLPLFSAQEDVLLNDCPFRSGVSHWLLLGRNEGRTLDYCPPVVAPLSPRGDEFLRDYQQRVEHAMGLPLADRGRVYAQLVFEALENNAPVVLSDLATIILRDMNVSYLKLYPEVNDCCDVDFSNRGVEHYIRFGRDGKKHSLLSFLQGNYKDILDEYSSLVAPRIDNAGLEPAGE